eukprot:2178837-Prymnesium_polylepis.1
MPSECPGEDISELGRRQHQAMAEVAREAQVLPEEPSWPEEPDLFQLVKAMLTGGTGVPAAPAKHFGPAKATFTLLERVKSVVKKLKDKHGDELHFVPGTAGRIDQQEGRGYLLGAVLGRGLLTREQAKAAGFDARNRQTALEKRFATQKELARKAA